MPRTRSPYPAEIRDYLIVLVKAGRSVESLTREFEPCAATIHGWVEQTEIDDGDRWMVCPVMNAKSFVASAARLSSCARSATYSQRPRLGLHRKTFHRPGLRIHD